MQEYATDYSKADEGCCLNCPSAHPGCLCTSCCCTKCYWYSSPYKWDGIKGHCNKTDELKEEGKRKIKEWYEAKAKEEYEKAKRLKKLNEKLNKKIREKGLIPNSYTFQKCQRLFVTEKDYKIIDNKSPICPICDGTLDSKESENGEPNIR